MANTRIVVRTEGPVFDGRAAAAADAFLNAVTKEVAEIGRDWIKVEAEGMDKSGRGGTGRAAEGVKLTDLGDAWMISGGIREGEYAWPWLEGVSKRNTDTSFKGYHTFRRTTFRLRRQATPYAQQKLAEYLPAMGGD